MPERQVGEDAGARKVQAGPKGRRSRPVAAFCPRGRE
jgi:hypothetical protein